jgi:hypothetical protein
VACTACLAGCSKTSGGAKPERARVVSLTGQVKAALARPYIAVRADETPAGSQYAMVPLDMWMPCRWEATFGVFDQERAQGLDSAYFGTSLDTRGGPDHLYHGIYAYVQPGGISVSTETNDTMTGDVAFLGGAFFAGATRVDAAIELDGTDMLFFARDSAAGGAWTAVGSMPFGSQPYALNPGIEVGGFTGRAEIGFDDLRVVANTPDPSPLAPAHAAIDAILGILADLAEARFTLTEDPAQTAAAGARLGAALARFSDAEAAIQAVPGYSARRSPARRALAKVRAVERKTGKAESRLDRKGQTAAARVNRSVGLRAFELVKAADAILPPDLREALPGTVDRFK